MRLTLPTLALLGSSLLAGCDGNEGRTDPPNASIQVIHAAPSIGPVTFKRVQVNATPLDFTQGATFSWDVDTYTLNFEILDVDGTVAQTVSTQVTLVEDMAYFLVLREVGGQPDPVLIERPAEIQGMGSEIEILHAATTLNAVDVYIDVDNFDLTTAASRGTIDFDGLLSVPALADGTYEIVLTDAGNQANVRLDSEGVGLSPLALAVGDANGTTIADRNSQSGIRVINSLADRETINVGIDGQLMPPLITDLAFATASAFELIASGDHDLNVEATLTPGTLEIDEPIEADVARFATWLITGSTGSMTATLFEDDFRVIPGESKLRVFIGATQNGVGVTDIFVVEPGTDITTVPPTLSSLSETPTPTVRIAPDNYEITVTEQATGAVLAGPIAATIAADGYYGILLTDAAAGTGTEVVLLFDF
jgi:hypothetical protein